MKSIVIWGAGGHAREVHWLCEILGREVVGFLDERPTMRGRTLLGLPVYNGLHEVIQMRHEVEVVCAGVGDPPLKAKFWQQTLEAGFIIAGPLIHPSVEVSRRNHIDTGVVICAGVTLTVDIQLGRGVILNRNVTVGHDVKLHDFVTVGPGAVISGNVTVGELSYIGTLAGIREKLHVGREVMLAGGAFLTQDMPDECLYAGVPAVFKKDLRR